MINKFVSIFLFLGILSVGTAKAECFKEHVKNAIEVNRERRELYANASNGKTRRLSNSYILWEKMILIPATYFQFKARKYQRAGIGVLCDDFISMDEIPDFREFSPLPIKFSLTKKIKIKAIKRRLKESLEQGISSFRNLNILLVQQLNEAPSYNCMTRHLFESMARTASLLPRYIYKAKQENLKSPEKFMKKYLKLQIFGLSKAHKLDLMAAPFQENGLAILCQDIPHIPYTL